MKNQPAEEKTKGYAYRLISEDFIKTYANALNSNFYVCSPPPMMDTVKKQLEHLQVDKKRNPKPKC